MFKGFPFIVLLYITYTFRVPAVDQKISRAYIFPHIELYKGRQLTASFVRLLFATGWLQVTTGEREDLLFQQTTLEPKAIFTIFPAIKCN